MSIHSHVLLTICAFLPALISLSDAEISIDVCNSDSPAARLAGREKVREMFYHGYLNYKNHALHFDELRPLSCDGVDTFGGIHITLIDSLDALAVFGDWREFTWAVKYVEASVPSFAITANVSVFETNIRVLGSLLSAHGLLTDAAPAAGWRPSDYYPDYNNGLLKLAVDLADRLIPAFDTPTGIPYGAVGLNRGVWPGETVVASTAGGGSLLVEFGTLSLMTGDPKYYAAAFRAVEGLHKRVAWTGLVGNHIDTTTGEWVAHESGIGALIDSYYEYMTKGYLLFGDSRLMDMFWEAYDSVRRYIRKGPWYLPVNMFSGQVSSFGHCSLGAFWPGMQVLLGDLDDAIETTRAHYSVWRRYGCIPEAYHVVAQSPATGTVNYPLRPELVESVFMLHWATNDSSWVGVAQSMLHSLETLTRVDCGFARLENAATHKKENVQGMAEKLIEAYDFSGGAIASVLTLPDAPCVSFPDGPLRSSVPDSFFLSETLKYLYLVFDSKHWLRSGRFVFSTEAHPLLIVAKPVPGVERKAPWWEVGARKPGHSRRAIHRRKCPRRSSLSSKSSCGFGMPGSDYPTLDLNQVRSEPISEDVTETIRARMALGVHPLQVGEVFFGIASTYRVVRVAGSEVMLSKLDETETQRAREESARRRLSFVYEKLALDRQVGFVNQCPHILIPELLVASAWELLDKCDKNGRSLSPTPLVTN